VSVCASFRGKRADWAIFTERSCPGPEGMQATCPVLNENIANDFIYVGMIFFGPW
jgi:hypothetical protein